MASPSATSQRTTSPSVSPSPRSGSLNSRSATSDVPPSALELKAPLDRPEDPVHAGQVGFLEPGRRVRDVEAGAAQDGGLQVEERGLGDQGRDLGAHAEELGGLV